MTLRSYLWGLRAGTVIMMGAFAAVIYLLSPRDFGVTAYVLFYTALFLSVMGLGALIFTGFWVRTLGDRMDIFALRAALRQGMLIAANVILLAVLQQMGILLWWNGLIVLALVLVIELHFLRQDMRILESAQSHK